MLTSRAIMIVSSSFLFPTSSWLICFHGIQIPSMAKHPVSSSLQIVVLYSSDYNILSLSLTVSLLYNLICKTNYLTVAFRALIACSFENPRLITIAIFSSEGVGPAPPPPPPPDPAAPAGLGGSNGKEKSGNKNQDMTSSHSRHDVYNYY